MIGFLYSPMSLVKLDILIEKEDNKNNKHPKCLGYKYWTGCGYEYDCEYDSNLTCDECKYGCGRKDPEAKCNKRK